MSPFVVQAGVFIALVLVAVLSRLPMVSVAPNFAAVGAAALFAGFYFRRVLVASCVPVLAMLLSDLFVGGYSWKLMLVVYVALTLPVLLGWLVVRPAARRANGVRLSSSPWIALSALSASILFFLSTNLAVWALAADASYPKTLAGLAQCFALALPFFRYTLLGDLAFTGVFFGIHALVASLVLRRANVQAQLA